MCLNKDKDRITCYCLSTKIFQFQLAFIVEVSGLLGQESMVLFNGFDIQLSSFITMILYNDIQK